MFTTHRLSVGDIDMWNLQNSLTEQILYTLINAKAEVTHNFFRKLTTA